MIPRPSAGISRSDPAWLVATWFGAGLVPKIPGTAASLAALPFAWIIQWLFGAVGLVAAGSIAIAAGLWACSKLVPRGSREDPGHIVIDEVAGQWLTLAPTACLHPDPDLLFYVTGFALFRLFDIMKPWPVDWTERHIPGGLGIMIDDVAAAAYAGAGAAFIYAYTHGVISFS